MHRPWKWTGSVPNHGLGSHAMDSKPLNCKASGTNDYTKGLPSHESSQRDGQADGDWMRTPSHGIDNYLSVDSTHGIMTLTWTESATLCPPLSPPIWALDPGPCPKHKRQLMGWLKVAVQQTGRLTSYISKLNCFSHQRLSCGPRLLPPLHAHESRSPDSPETAH